MLHQTIESIASSTDLGKDRLWDYKISGNTLELYSRPDYLREPEQFRCSVIEIGSVIQEVEHHMKSSGCLLHLHSFPNLNESALIAQLRYHSLSGISDPLRKRSDRPAATNGGLESILRSTAAHFDLLCHACKPDRKEQLTRILERTGKSSNEGPLYLIASTLDNPFVWLKVGRWIRKAEEVTAVTFVYSVRIDQDERRELAVKGGEYPYVQALLQTA